MITVHTSQTTARPDLARGQAFAAIYIDGQLTTMARAASDAAALREAVRMFRLTRFDRKRAESPTESVGWCPCCFAGSDAADAAAVSHEEICDECRCHVEHG